MAIARIRSFAFAGIEATSVDVEVQISNGLPSFTVVGLADKAVGEARERVRAVLTTLGVPLPPRRILVNLAPADLLKEGSHFDLPIAVALLCAMEVLPLAQVSRFAVLGELSLDGRINPVVGVLSAAVAAAAAGLGLICPRAQGGEAAWAGRMEILAPGELSALVEHFRGTRPLGAPEPAGVARPASGADLAEVKGMQTARRGLEIAAAGGHNLLLIGPPGSGKSMLAARLPGLLPDLTPQEALEVSMVHSVAGMLEGGRLLQRPPYREPHHTASQVALVGGGRRGQPGEISLAHRGVLFLDELPEFPRVALEAMRQPLEVGRATVARAAIHVTYPARFQLIAAMNPCNCGLLADAERACSRAPRCGEEYAGRLSGPWLDRIDLTVTVQPLTSATLARSPPGETSAVVAARVAAARDRQRARWGAVGGEGESATTNAEVGGGQIQPSLLPEALDLLERASERLHLSARGFTRIMRVARTIADLAGAARVGRAEVSEALAFRMRQAG